MGRWARRYPGGTGVFPIQVDVTTEKGITGRVAAAEIALVGDLRGDRLQGSDRDLAQHQLLVEVLTAHDVGLALQADLLGEAAALGRRATAA
jgi:hypothetical protein